MHIVGPSHRRKCAASAAGKLSCRRYLRRTTRDVCFCTHVPIHNEHVILLLVQRQENLAARYNTRINTQPIANGSVTVIGVEQSAVLVVVPSASGREAVTPIPWISEGSYVLKFVGNNRKLHVQIVLQGMITVTA